MTYKRDKFGKFIEKLNNEKCFMLSQLFDNLNKLRHVEFKYKNKKIIPNFLVDYYKLIVYSYNFNWKGYYMEKID
jgi:hypothetical protein